MALVPPTSDAAEQAFYDAIAQGDAQGVMALWADVEGAACCHPGRPRQVGIKAIRASFEEMLAGGGLSISTHALHCWRGADVAVHNLIERITMASPEGMDVIESVTTNVYVRLPQGWRILLHHSGFSDEFESDEDIDLHALSAQIRHWIERGAEDDEDIETQRPPQHRLH
jgi:ketosteroid isomerase-like protein